MISIIIPLYNKEKSIVRTLDSVLQQNFTDYEVIIVNDGSTDQSAQVVEDWIFSHLNASPSRPFRLISQLNAGVSAARNKGLALALGEYIAFLDGDDLWHPMFLEELHALITEYPDAGIYGIYTKQITGENYPSLTDIYQRAYFEDKDWPQSGPLFTGSSACIRRDVFDSIDMFDIRMTHGEDLDLWWRVLAQYRGAYSTKPLAYYRQDAENRAMQRLVPLSKHIPYYLDKHTEHRMKNLAFRKFFDTEMIYKLYPYLFDKTYKTEAQRLAGLLDYKHLKWSLKFRMQYPHLYKFYLLFKRR